jgi:hypothetical protein
MMNNQNTTAQTQVGFYGIRNVKDVDELLGSTFESPSTRGQFNT